MKRRRKIFILPSSIFHLPSKYLIAFFLSLTLLSSCTFLYIPPLRESLEIPVVLNIDGSRGLYKQADDLTLSVQLNKVPQQGWLMVQWYSDTNEEVASDSQWISSKDEGFALTYVLPGKVDLKAGDWRAVVSFGETLIRQFSFTLEN